MAITTLQGNFGFLKFTRILSFTSLGVPHVNISTNHESISVEFLPGGSVNSLCNINLKNEYIWLQSFSVQPDAQITESYADFPSHQQTDQDVPEDQPTDSQVLVPRRSTRIHKPPDRYGFETRLN